MRTISNPRNTVPVIRYVRTEVQSLQRSLSCGRVMHYIHTLQSTIFFTLFLVTVGLFTASAHGIQPVHIEFHGSIIEVSTTADEDNGYLGGGMGISLREAVQYADESAIVIVPAGTYALDNTFSTGLTIGKDVIVKGSGTGKTIILGNTRGSVFTILPQAELLLSDVTIGNGSATRGGAIYNKGSLLMYSVAMTGNRASDGGALYNEGIAELRSCIVQANNAEYYGGGIHNDGGTLTLTDTGLLRNTAIKGGGLYNQFGYTVIKDGTIFGNTAGSGGGVADYIGMTEISNTSASDNYGGNFEGSILTLGSNYDSDGSSNFSDGIAGDVVKPSLKSGNPTDNPDTLHTCSTSAFAQVFSLQ